MADVMNRRAALGALAVLPTLGVPALGAAIPGGSDTLSDLIAAHRETWDGFRIASDELEAAGPSYHTPFVGFGDREYVLGIGRDEIAKRITDDFENDAEVLRRVNRLSSRSASPALAALTRERDAALSRLDAIFAPEAEARKRYDETCDVERDALMAICAHRCGSPNELIRKFRFLKEYECDLLPEQYDAIFDSFLPETHFDGA
jgi:hypothetical protein